MSEFRKLVDKLQKIEEGFYSKLATEVGELVRANPGLSPVQLVQLTREIHGQEAATWLSDRLEAEGDAADYFAEEEKELPSPKNLEPDKTGYEHLRHPDDVADLEKQKEEDFWDWIGKNPFESVKENYGKETHADMVDYWTESLKSSMVRKGVWEQAVEAVGGDMQELNWAIQDEANSIADSYHGTGEGIGTSDINHFIVSVFSQLGVEDVFGWNKRREGVGEDASQSFWDDVAKGDEKIAEYGLAEFGDMGFQRNSNWPSGTTLVAINDLRKQIRTKFRLEGWTKQEDNWYQHPSLPYMSTVEYDRGRTLVTSMLPYGAKIEEDIINVPNELRGDLAMVGKATSDDAEEFMRDLDIDDEVSDDVVDPETGELLFQPGQTKREEMKKGAHVILNRDDFVADAKLSQPILHSGFNTNFEVAQDAAYELLAELRDSDFYNIVWRNVTELIDDPDTMGDDYDIDADVPVILKRKDGQRLDSDDHDNIKEIVHAVRNASTMQNVGIMYMGSTNGGTTARFTPTFH